VSKTGDRRLFFFNEKKPGSVYLSMLKSGELRIVSCGVTGWTIQNPEI
jgi:hypothetical protein